jgi:putative DNA primase/helicase
MNSIDWHPVSKQTPCKICGKLDWCSLSADQTVAACRRVENGSFKTKHDRNGCPVYLHLLAPKAQDAHGSNAEELNAVYSALLTSLTLSGLHHSALRMRGLSDETIICNCYRTLPVRGRARIARSLKEKFGALILKVPGFVLKNRNDEQQYLTIAGSAGVLIPVRDPQRNIIALKVRADDTANCPRYSYLSSTRHGGLGPGSPVHVPIGISIPAHTLRLTEGELKADVATALSSIPTISVAGATTWRGCLPILEHLGCKIVRLSFDADAARKLSVAQSILACAATLTSSGFVVELERWNEPDGKGIDDLLAAGKYPSVVTGEAVLAAIQEIVAAAGGTTTNVTETTAPNSASQKQQPKRSCDVRERFTDPHRLAGIISDRMFTDSGDLLLRYWREEYWLWRRPAYERLPEAELRALATKAVKEILDEEHIQHYGNLPLRDRPLVPTVSVTLINNVMEALAGKCLVPFILDQPTWLGSAPFSARETLLTGNYLIHLPSLVTGLPCSLVPTPRFFSANALDYPFDPAATCPHLLSFLNELWPDDLEAVDLLWQWSGYLLGGDTSQHRILLMVGPARSGKGTIGRVLAGLLGPQNVAAPPLSSLQTNFGMSQLLGKTVAIVADARLSGRADISLIVERLLAISGEDRQTIDRKYREPVTVPLPTRFIILSNELPSLKDTSTALVSRMLILRLYRSWLGKEDRTLTRRLLDELSGILNWGIAGWLRLRLRGYFVQPKSGHELLQTMEELSSPLSAFIDECCVVDEALEVTMKELFQCWKGWCLRIGRDHPGTQQTLARDLLAAIPTLRKIRKRDGADRRRGYAGIGLRPQ